VLADYRAAVRGDRPPAADRVPDIDPALATAILAHYQDATSTSAPPALQPLREKLERGQTRPE
jgi:hypothetical protein